MSRGKKSEIVCAFCSRNRDEAPQMISSPTGVFICADCVRLCSNMVFGDEEEGDFSPDQVKSKFPELEIVVAVFSLIEGSISTSDICKSFLHSPEKSESN